MHSFKKMILNLFKKRKKEFYYVEKGVGATIIILHGLMGGVSNFNGILNYLPKKGYNVIMLKLPVYNLALPNANIKYIAEYVRKFIEYKNLKKTILLGNSLGGHIALVFTKKYPELVKGLILTGSSGLYENSFNEGYPKRKSYEYVKRKTEEVFYDSSIATKEIVDDIYKNVNDRLKLLVTLKLAKNAITNNMAKDLSKMEAPTAIIWGKNDIITPPHVAEQFNELIPNSNLFWIDKCGHAPMMEHPDTFNEIMLGWLKDNKI